jgi:p-hydroxybenzoate 3-monooxygenase
MEEAGCADRLHAEGFVHDGTLMSYGDDLFRIDFARPEDARRRLRPDRGDARPLRRARGDGRQDRSRSRTSRSTTPTAMRPPSPIPWTASPAAARLRFHRRLRRLPRRQPPEHPRRRSAASTKRSIPSAGSASCRETPPVNDELIYANSDRGFALCSMRNAAAQPLLHPVPAVGLGSRTGPTRPSGQELKRRIPARRPPRLSPARRSRNPSRRCAPSCASRCAGAGCSCAGDAAHIVPPTGAKGLNTAASDVHYLYPGSRILSGRDRRASTPIRKGAGAGLEGERFSWWLTSLMHRYPDQSEFDLRMQQAELDFLRGNGPPRRRWRELCRAALLRTPPTARLTG